MPAAGPKRSPLLSRLSNPVPQRRIHHSRISRLKTEIHSCSNIVFVQDFLPCPPAVRRTENSALFVGPRTVAHRRNQDDIRIVWIDQDSSYMSRVFQSGVLPVLSAVKRLVNSLSIAAVGKNRIHARSNVNDVRTRRRQRHRSNRSDRLLVENWLPHRPSVRRFPHAPAIRRKIIDRRIPRHARHGVHFSGAKWPNHPPFHPPVKVFTNLLRRRDASSQNSGSDQESCSSSMLSGIRNFFQDAASNLQIACPLTIVRPCSNHGHLCLGFPALTEYRPHPNHRWAPLRAICSDRPERVPPS